MAETGYTQQPYAQSEYTVAGGNQGLGAQFTAIIQGGIEDMSYDGAENVKTIRDNEFKVMLVDKNSGEAADNILSIVQPGDAIVADTNDYAVLVIGKDTSGNAQAIKMETDGTIHVTHPGDVNVTATDLDIRDLTAASDSVAISDGTDTLAVNADGSINAVISDGGGSITVDGAVTVSATDLDIRDLSAAQDNVAISDGTDTLAVNADGSINAIINDGGGSITVDGAVTVSATDLDIRDLSAAQDNVAISDGTDTLDINADGSINAVIADGGGSITVDAVDLDIRDLTHASDSVKVGDGTEFLAVNTDGSINVRVQPDTGDTDVCEYTITATAPVGTPVNHDYVVPSGEVFRGESVLVGCRSQCFIRVGTWNGTTFTPLFSYWQDPKENYDHNIKRLALTGDGTAAVRIEITPKDGAADDVSSTLQGYLNA
jgi:hypothetical protein